MDAVEALWTKACCALGFPPAQGRFDVEEPYFGMYVSIHEYAARSFTRLGGGSEACEERHGRYFAGFGTEEALEALFGTEESGGAACLHSSLDNFVVDGRRAVGRGEGNGGRDLSGGCGKC